MLIINPDITFRTNILKGNFYDQFYWTKTKFQWNPNIFYVKKYLFPFKYPMVLSNAIHGLVL